MSLKVRIVRIFKKNYWSMVEVQYYINYRWTVVSHSFKSLGKLDSWETDSWEN